MIELANALKLLGDDTRLRIMRLISREPLNVSELTSILGLAQSGISRHLGMLRNAGLVEERREGVWTYYQLPELLRISSAEGLLAAGGNGNGNGAPDANLRHVWDFVRSQLTEADDPFSDLPRLAEVLRQRENFGSGLSERLLEPGQSWFAWSRALQFMLPPIEVIDLGCGDGIITVEMARFARRVVGVDQNASAILAAQRRAQRERRENVTFREGQIEALDEPDASFDLAVFSQSLHHMEHTELGVREAVRLLRPGGRLIVIDLAPHQQHWVTAKLGHRHLGFEAEQLAATFRQEGLDEVAWEGVNQRRGEVFRVILVTGVKPRSA